MIYLQLFYEFFKTGLFAVGGGLATLPFLYSMSDKTGWFTYEQLADMVAISESTPGPIGINMATYVGFQTGGIAGSVVATLGIIAPAIIVIIIIAGFLKKFQSNEYVQDVFYGLRPASVGMITAAFVSVLTMSVIRIDLFQASGVWTDLFSIEAILLAAVIYILTNKTKWHPAFFLLGSAIVGVIFKF